MTEAEIETLLISLVGDNKKYLAMLQQAQDASLQAGMGIAKALGNAEAVIRSLETPTDRYLKVTAELVDMLRKGELTQEQFSKAVENAGKAYQGASGHIHLSMLDLRHGMHAIAMAGILPHEVTRSVMMAMYSYRLFGHTIGKLIGSFSTLQKIMIFSGIGAAIAGVMVLSKVYAILSKKQEEMEKSAREGFDSIAKGAKTTKEAMEEIGKHTRQHGISQVGDELMTGRSVTGRAHALWTQGGNVWTEATRRGMEVGAIAAERITTAIEESRKSQELLNQAVQNPAVIAALREEANTRIGEDVAKEKENIETEIHLLGRGADYAKRYKQALAMAGHGLSSDEAMQRLEGSGLPREQADLAAKKTKHEITEKVGDSESTGRRIVLGEVEAEILKTIQEKAKATKLDDENIREAELRVREQNNDELLLLRTTLEQNAALKISKQIEDAAAENRRSGLNTNEAERLKTVQEYAKTIKTGGESIEESEIRARRLLAVQLELKKVEQEKKTINEITDKVTDKGLDVDKQRVELEQGKDAAERFALALEFVKKNGGTVENAFKKIDLELLIMRGLQKDIASIKLRGETEKIQDEAKGMGMLAEEGKRFGLVQEYAKNKHISFMEALKEMAPELEKIKAAQDAMEGQKLWDETRKPAEKYQREIAKLDNLLQSGAIDQELYGRGVEKANREILKQGAALKDVQGSLAGSADAQAKIAQYKEGTRREMNPNFRPAAPNQGKGLLEKLFGDAVNILKRIDAKGNIVVKVPPVG